MSADKKVKFDDLIRTGRDVDALRYFAKEYYDNGKMGHTRKMLVEEAADLIESLQAEITQLKDELADYNCDTKVGCKLIEEVKAERDAAVAENERLAKHGGKYIQLSDERYKMYEKAVKRAEDAEIKLAESQRRERAAVADIMCDNYIDLAGYAACAGELATEVSFEAAEPTAL